MEVKILQKNYDLIIRNGIVVFNDSVKKADIGVYDGKIVEINDEISGDANEIIDALGFHIFPATTDGHVHSSRRVEMYMSICCRWENR